MRKLLAILIACQLLINSGLAFAHMATDAQDPHEKIHAHSGADHGGAAEHNSGEHDHDCHFHLCALALGNFQSVAPERATGPETPFLQLRVNLSASPPVPPPNA